MNSGHYPASGRSGEADRIPRSGSANQSSPDPSGSPSSTDHPRRGHALPRSIANDPRSSHNSPRCISNDPRSNHNSPRCITSRPRCIHNSPRCSHDRSRCISNDRKEHRIAAHDSINAMDPVSPEHTRNRRARTPTDKRAHITKPHARHNRHRPQTLARPNNPSHTRNPSPLTPATDQAVRSPRRCRT